MPNQVDLSTLYTISGGDVEFERQIFNEFMSSFDEKFQVMRDHCANGNREDWETTAHSIESLSTTIGANKLSELCGFVQNHADAPAEVKSYFLSKIESEYDLVREFIRSV